MEVKRLFMYYNLNKYINNKFKDNNINDKENLGRGIICIKRYFYVYYFSAFFNIILFLWIILEKMSR